MSNRTNKEQNLLKCYNVTKKIKQITNKVKKQRARIGNSKESNKNKVKRDS